MTKNAFFWPIRVYYEETDAGGVVYHSNYLNFMERARTEWLRQLGFGQQQLYQQRGLLFAVTRMEVQFLAPARLDDALLVSVLLHAHKQASLVVQQTIQRVQEQRHLVQASVRIAVLNQQFKPTRLPNDLLLALGESERAGMGRGDTPPEITQTGQYSG